MKTLGHSSLTVLNDCQLGLQKSQDSITECLSQLQEATSDSCVLIDFDETLFLRNSTEEYLDTFLRHLQLVDVELHACRLWLGAVDRISGKFNRLKRLIGADAIANSTVATDSRNDIELLRAARRAYLIQWPQSSYVQAMTSAYAPLLYVFKFKHSLKYLRHGIWMDQWLLLVLASSWTAPHPILHAVGLLFLVASFIATKVI